MSEHASPLAVLGDVDAGGQNVHVAALAMALAKLGHEVVVHTRRDSADLPDTVAMAPGVVVDHVAAGPARPLPKDELVDHMPCFGAELGRRWADAPPDVVHAHFWMSGMASLPVCRTLGIPFVQTFHALGTVKRRHQGAADTSPPQRLEVEATLACAADRIVATCSDEVFELKRMGANGRRTVVVPCGVNLTRFTPDGPVAPRPPGVHRLLSVGRLVERKGVGEVIAALAEVPGAELLVAGGPDRARLAGDPEAARLAALAADHGVADRVQFLGRVGRDDLPALLRSADAVVCVPWYEPFGIVPLEAMACGVPVVAASVGGLIDSVVDDVTGIHVPPRDHAALVGALGHLLGDEALRRRLGAGGVRRAQTRFGWARVARSTAQVYEDLLAAAPARRGAKARR
ncbi:MAG TPA: glycosyltransferase [Acidimicrobiales bacterium]|nr:glycosyltransferase [Acidimicrobiales bacterium]